MPRPAVRVPHCQHVFHDECLQLWLADHDKCPNCRSKIIAFEQEVHAARDFASRQDQERFAIAEHVLGIIIPTDLYESWELFGIFRALSGYQPLQRPQNGMFGGLSSPEAMTMDPVRRSVTDSLMSGVNQLGLLPHWRHRPRDEIRSASAMATRSLSEDIRSRPSHPGRGD